MMVYKALHNLVPLPSLYSVCFWDETAGRALKVVVEVSGPLRRPLVRAYRKTKRKLLEGGRRGLYYLEAESLAMLLPVATCKIKDVPNELDDQSTVKYEGKEGKEYLMALKDH